jgi:RNA polymerase sigma factor (sigma-70 family)
MGTMTTEERLTARLADDLDDAFPDVVRLLGADLYSGALRMLGNPHDAEEVAQDALIRAYHALSEYPRERIEQLRLRGWVWTIAANLCRNRLRSRARRPTVPIGTDPADDRPGPEAAAAGAETLRELAGSLLTLPWPMRAAVVLRHVVGLSAGEISEAVGRPPATVRSDIHRGLARLRALHSQEELR